MPYNFTVWKGSASGDIVESTTQRPDLTGDQVYLELTHSGVCGTDIHYKHADIVLGHEGVGEIKAVGPDVKELKVGDRAGWGYTVASCERCEFCLQGRVFYCSQREIYGVDNLDQGSFGKGAIWREHALYKIPDNMSSDVAAPMMCAGATVWSALVEYGLKATDCVGIVGVGGLGHLAIQFAAKLGCEVVVFSGSDNKKEEAFQLGAHHFVATKGVKEIQVPRKVDYLIVTASVVLDWSQYTSALKPMATILPLALGEADANLIVPYNQFLLSGWRFIGSTNPAKAEYNKMLEFAALHNIKPTIEAFPFNKKGIEASLNKLDKEGMRYRAVLYADKA